MMRWSAVAMAWATATAACLSAPQGAIMATTDQALLGQWTRHSGGPCAAGYAAHLRFDANGLYFGSTEPPGGFTWWDGGTWRITGAGRISLSTANDAVISYGYTLDGDLLWFSDDKDCRFSFRRVR
jgi:hypothetical protein